MSGTRLQEGIEVIDQIEGNHIIERASIEPEDPHERAALLGHSKKPIPKRVIFLFSLTLLYLSCSISVSAAEIDLLYRIICLSKGIDQDKCLASKEVNTLVTNYVSVSSLVVGIPTLLMNTWFSMLSDRLGRKPIFMNAMILGALSQMGSWWLVFKCPYALSYWVLLVPGLIEAMGGGLPILVKLTTAYIADLVPDAGHRTKLIGMTDGMLSTVLTFAPSVGSFILRKKGLSFLYIASFTGMIFAAVLNFFFLKESVNGYNKRRNSTNRRAVLSSISLLKFKHLDDKESRWNAIILLIGSICTMEAGTALVPIIFLYARRQFGWAAVQTGYLTSAISSVHTFWYLLGFPIVYTQLAKVWNVHKDKVDKVDRALLLAYLAIASSGFLLMGWSTSQESYVAAAVYEGCAAVGRTVFASAFIKYVPSNQYGAFMAAQGLLGSTLGVLVPVLYLRLYGWAANFRPYVPFEITATVFALVIVLILFLKPAR